MDIRIVGNYLRMVEPIFPKKITTGMEGWMCCFPTCLMRNIINIEVFHSLSKIKREIYFPNRKILVGLNYTMLISCIMLLKQ